MSDDTRRVFNLPIALVCVAIGAGLFAWMAAGAGFGAPPEGLMSGVDPRLAFFFTPLFLAPILIYGVWSRRFGIGWAIGLFIGVTVFHGIALQAAGLTYHAATPNSIERILENSDWQRYRAAHAAEIYARARGTAITGGLLGGAIGAGTSFMLLAAALRERNLLTALIATIVLACVGAFSLSDISVGPIVGHLPELKSSLEYALRLFLPWQLVFGLAMALMMQAAEPRPVKPT